MAASPINVQTYNGKSGMQLPAGLLSICISAGLTASGLAHKLLTCHSVTSLRVLVLRGALLALLLAVLLLTLSSGMLLLLLLLPTGRSVEYPAVEPSCMAGAVSCSSCCSAVVVRLLRLPAVPAAALLLLLFVAEHSRYSCRRAPDHASAIGLCRRNIGCVCLQGPGAADVCRFDCIP